MKDGKFMTKIDGFALELSATDKKIDGDLKGYILNGVDFTPFSTSIIFYQATLFNMCSLHMITTSLSSLKLVKTLYSFSLWLMLHLGVVGIQTVPTTLVGVMSSTLVLREEMTTTTTVITVSKMVIPVENM
jgi:hypothetical protein